MDIERRMFWSSALAPLAMLANGFTNNVARNFDYGFCSKGLFAGLSHCRPMNLSPGIAAISWLIKSMVDFKQRLMRQVRVDSDAIGLWDNTRYDCAT